MNQDPIISTSRKGYMIDLLPYYAELQSQGIPTIINFVKEISAHFKEQEKYSLYSIGSYTIAVLFKQEKTWTENECLSINNAFREIFLQFGVLKSLSDTPEGVYYYDQKNIGVLLEMISASSDKVKDVSHLRAAG
jgi:hypothetical protein